MNKREVFAVALRFISLNLFLVCCSNLVKLIYTVFVGVPSSMLSLFSLSGNYVTIGAVLFYGISGFILFKKADFISKKLIPINTSSIASRGSLIQIAILYQGISGVLYGVLYGVSLIIASLYTISYDGFSYSFSILFTKGLFFIVEVFIGIIILKYYEKISNYLLKKIPQKFWG